LYHQWPDEASMQAAVKLLLSRIGRLAPEEVGDEVASQAGEAESPSAVPESVVAPPPPAMSEPEPAIADADKKPEAPEEEIVATRPPRQWAARFRWHFRRLIRRHTGMAWRRDRSLSVPRWLLQLLALLRSVAG